jgi:hypothetical protein
MQPMRRKRRGANAVEFALTIPYFLLITFIMIDWGWYFGVRAAMEALVSVGCRNAALTDPMLVDVPAVTQDALGEMLNAIPGATCGAGCIIEVAEVGEVPGRSLLCKASLPYTPLTNFGIAPSHLATATIMRYEWQRPPDEGF